MPPISRRQLLGTAAALVAGGLAACGGGNGSQASTTLLVYLLGSDLESRGNAGTKNLLEMLAAQGSSYTKVVITTGGAAKDDPTSLVSSWKTVKRFELTGGKLNELADLGRKDMDSGGTLQEFLLWATGAYPAERTMLMLWDHGSGYYGYGKDENFPASGKKMSLPAMAAALQGFKSATGITLDYIGFDACLMATVEVAKMLQPYARYLGASQELEPGSGWDWKVIVDTLARQPALPAPEFGKVAAQAFHDKQMRERPDGSLVPPLSDYVTFSIIDLSRIPALLEQLDQWAGAVLAYYDQAAKAAGGPALSASTVFWPPTFGAPALALQAKALSGAEGSTVDPSIERWKQVAMSRLRTTEFGYQPDAKAQLDLVDLHQFSALLATADIASASQPALSQALQDAIVFNITGPKAPEANGLSVYFPMLARSDLQRGVYQALDMPAQYMRLIERHAEQAKTAPSVIHVPPLTSPADAPDAVQSEISSVYGVRLADLMLIQPVNQTVVKITGTTPLVSGQLGFNTDNYLLGGVVRYDTRWWLQLDGQPLLLFTLAHWTADEGELTAVLLGTPVRLKSATGSDPRIVLMLFNCTWDPSTQRISGQIVGARDIDFDDADAPPDRVDADINVGDIVEPVHILYDIEKKVPAQEPGGDIAIEFGPPVTLTAQSALRASPLAPGAYTLQLAVTDLADGRGFSAPLHFVKS